MHEVNKRTYTHTYRHLYEYIRHTCVKLISFPVLPRTHSNHKTILIEILSRPTNESISLLNSITLLWIQSDINITTYSKV